MFTSSPKIPSFEEKMTTATRNEWWALLASMIKIIEVVVLWKFNVSKIWWITGLSWAYFLLGVTMLELPQLFR